MFGAFAPEPALEAKKAGHALPVRGCAPNRYQSFEIVFGDVREIDAAISSLSP